MGISRENQGRIPKDPNVSEEDYRTAQEVSDDYEKSSEESFSQRAGRIKEAADKTRTKYVELMGDETYRSYRAFRQEHKIQLLELLEPPNGPDIADDELRDIKKGKVTAFLNEKSISMDAMKEISGEFGTILNAEPQESEGGESKIVLPSAVPASNDLDGVSMLKTYKPPFDGWQQGTYTNPDGIVVNVEHYLDKTSGFVGNQTRLDCTHPDDLDIGQARLDTQVGFWYKPDRAGLIEMYLSAQCTIGRHYLRIADDVGRSHNSSRQDNYMMMHVIHPNISGPTLHRMSWISHTGVPFTSSTTDKEYLTRWKVYVVHMYSDAPIPANKSVFIRCGTRSWNASATDDATVHAKTTFKYFIKAARVRSTG